MWYEISENDIPNLKSSALVSRKLDGRIFCYDG